MFNIDFDLVTHSHTLEINCCEYNKCTITLIARCYNWLAIKSKIWMAFVSFFGNKCNNILRLNTLGNNIGALKF